jgi:hypothetical protein
MNSLILWRFSGMNDMQMIEINDDTMIIKLNVEAGHACLTGGAFAKVIKVCGPKLPKLTMPKLFMRKTQ